MVSWIFKFIRKFGTLLLILWLLYLGWQHLGPEKAEIGALRQNLADKAVVEVTESLRKNRGGLQDVVLFHFSNDHTGYLTDQLRDSLTGSGVFNLRDRTFWEKVRKNLNLTSSMSRIESRSSAIATAKDAGAQGALTGNVVRFESSPDEAFLEFTYELIDVRTGKTAYQGRYDNTSAPPALPEAVQKIVEDNPWIFKTLTWLLLVLTLPIFTIRFIREMVAKRSHKVNAFVLGIYTAVDALLAVLLVGATLATVWGALGFLTLLAIAFIYNGRILTYVLHHAIED